MAETYVQGMDAIDAELRRVHGEVNAVVLRGLLPAYVEPHPCKQIGAWPIGGARPHWHLVTYGLSELFEKVSNLADQSGWGHELTMRVPRAEGEDGPPGWAVNLLRALVQYVTSTRHAFGVDHYLPLDDRFPPGSTLSGATFTKDPAFPQFTTPNGRLYFLQLVGVTADELTATMRVDDQRVLKALALRDPLLTTDLARRSVFEGPGAPAFPGEPAQGVTAPASFALKELTFRRQFTGWWELGVPSVEATRIADVLTQRMLKDQPLTLGSEFQRVIFRPGADAGWERDDESEVVTVSVSPSLLAELQQVMHGASVGEAMELASLPDLRLVLIR